MRRHGRQIEKSVSTGYMQPGEPQSPSSFAESKDRLREALAHFEASTASVDRLAAVDEVLALHQAVRETANRLIGTEPLLDNPGATESAVAVSIRREGAAPDALDVERLNRVRMRIEEDESLTHISVRVPAFLGKYVATYVARTNEISTKRRDVTSKQDVIGEALCLFYALHPLPPSENDVWEA